MTVVVSHTTALNAHLSREFNHQLHPGLPYLPGLILGSELCRTSFQELLQKRQSTWKDRRRMRTLATQIHPFHAPTAEEYGWARQRLQIDDGETLHALVPHPSLKANNRHHRATCHVASLALPARSFTQLSHNIWLASPELAFLQCARSLELPRLAQAGMALCGTYAAVVGGGTKYGIYPVTSQRLLSQYLALCTGVSACKRALAALKFVADGAASPMETIVMLRLCLPPRYGGYGFPLPRCNMRIDVPTSLASSAWANPYYVVDFCWPEQKLIIEYDGKEPHDGRIAATKDASKRNALLAMGYNVATLTAEQVRSVAAFDKTARILAKALGKRLWVGSTEHTERHYRLNEMLYRG